MSALFPAGDIVATAAATELVQEYAASIDSTFDRVAVTLVGQHAAGMFGKVSAEDAAANRRALTTGERVLSEYWLPDEHHRIWIVTEADRSVTTLLLPEEYK